MRQIALAHQKDELLILANVTLFEMVPEIPHLKANVKLPQSFSQMDATVRQLNLAPGKVTSVVENCTLLQAFTVIMGNGIFLCTELANSVCHWLFPLSLPLLRVCLFPLILSFHL